MFCCLLQVRVDCCRPKNELHFTIYYLWLSWDNDIVFDLVLLGKFLGVVVVVSLQRTCCVMPPKSSDDEVLPNINYCSCGNDKTTALLEHRGVLELLGRYRTVSTVSGTSFVGGVPRYNRQGIPHNTSLF